MKAERWLLLINTQVNFGLLIWSRLHWSHHWPLIPTWLVVAGVIGTGLLFVMADDDKLSFPWR